MSAQKNQPILKRLLIVLFISILVLSSVSCTNPLFELALDSFMSEFTDETDKVIVFGQDADSSVISESDGSVDNGGLGSVGDDTSTGASGGESSTGSISGDLKPVGFVNYGEFDATVRANSYIPLGETNPVPAPAASTVSSAKTGSGTWPNTSRFISVPMGTYSWCIDWEEGDLDDDGQIDYFYYIEEGPTLLDENDSDDLDKAEEVAISAPPATAPAFAGKCPVLDNSCAGQPQETRIYSSPGWVNGTIHQPKIQAPANYFDYPSPEGITLTNGGGSQFQQAIILVGGQYLEATTSNPYSAMGVQPHGDSTIGWARVLFDGVEVWRGDTSSYWHDAEAYVHAVYIEVRCFPPGTHTMRIEALGIAGSGGGQTVPIAFFGFRP